MPQGLIFQGIMKPCSTVGKWYWEAGISLLCGKDSVWQDVGETMATGIPWSLKIFHFSPQAGKLTIVFWPNFNFSNCSKFCFNSFWSIRWFISHFHSCSNDRETSNIFITTKLLYISLLLCFSSYLISWALESHC